MSVPGKMHSFFVPGISLIGVGACHGIPHYVHTYHITKPLIVTDKGIVNTGILKTLRTFWTATTSRTASMTRPCRIPPMKT